jgi:hypothetical protein
MSDADKKKLVVAVALLVVAGGLFAWFMFGSGDGGGEEIVGEAAPVVQTNDGTPAAAKNATASSAVKRASTLRIDGGVLPAKSASVTLQCVTLQRPPPATRIFAPSFREPSTAKIESGAAADLAVRPAQAAANSPAAPAPTITISASLSGRRPLGSAMKSPFSPGSRR